MKAQAGYLDQVDELGDIAGVAGGVVPGEVAGFAGRRAALDIGTLSRYGAGVAHLDVAAVRPG